MNFSFQLLFRACFDFLGLKTGAGGGGGGGGGGTPPFRHFLIRNRVVDLEDQDFLGYHPCWEN